MQGVSQPSGSVTLVFTDIEGLTRLLRELGAARSFAEEAISESSGPRQRVRGLSSMASATLASGDLERAHALLLEVAGAWKGRHDFKHAYALLLLGEVAEQRGAPAEAESHVRAALIAFADLRDVDATAACLVHLARLDSGPPDRAGRLLGAARSMREREGLDPVELPASVPLDAVDASAGMTLDEAVEYARSLD
jgi:hypothetical protein